jgi:multidrug transporter EmrE-like cation transporter
MRNYLYIFGTIFFTVYGQLITKWQVTKAGPLPTDSTERMWFLLRVVVNPWVISSLAAAFLAFLFWVFAMTKFDLSHAYPFTSLAFLLVMIFSGVFLHEPITLLKILGTILIMAGIIVGSNG